MEPVCVKCAVVMECSKAGQVVRWNEFWCYSGDRYRCPTCGVEVVLFGVTAKGYEYIDSDPDLIEMADKSLQSTINSK